MLILLISSFAFCDEHRAKFNSKSVISGLKWDGTRDTQEPRLQVRESAKSDQKPYYVLLHGKYTQKAGELLFKAKKVLRKEDGSFDLEVEINGAQTEFQVMSIDAAGSVQVESGTLLFPEWEALNQKFNEKSKKRWALDLKRIRVSSTYLTNRTGNNFTGGVDWTPQYGTPKFKIQATLGALPLNNGSRFYVAMEYALGCSFLIYKRFWADTSFGMQYWSDRQTNALAANGNILYQLDRRTILGIHQFIVGYSAFLPTGYFTSEIRAGVGIQF
jgi:hypothetical protein